VALASLAAGLPPAFGASAYPDRPIRLVVPSVPGGGTDISMRIVAPKLAELLEQQIVIENRGGAASNIGAEIVAKAPPDGCTLIHRDRAKPAGFAPVAAGEEREGAHRLRQGAAGAVAVCLGGAGQRAAPHDGVVQ
jgi:tripartite-type tricarboxylate transporter receptor subunit TctC